MSVKGLFSSTKRKLNPGNATTEGAFVCPVCKQQTEMMPLPAYYLAQWQKYQSIHNVFFAETLNLQHYNCSSCGASDRERLYSLFLERLFISSAAIKLLDIAPATPLAKFIRSFPQVSYRSMDLYMENADDKFDITDMSGYTEGQFDVFICSHVLEHIPDDRKAMQELYRILKPGGTGIAMVPINLKVEMTLEDPSITDIPRRWKYFAQDDHVRMYAKSDFLARLQAAGFKTELLGIQHFGAEAFERAAIFPTSVLYLVHK